MLRVQRRACVALSAVIAPVLSDCSPLSILTANSVVADSGAPLPRSAGSRLTGDSGMNTNDRGSIGSPDEDRYFDSPNEKRLRATPQDVQAWLVKIKQFADCYGAAGASLLSKVEQSSRDGGAQGALETEDVSRHVMNIVLNACETHMETDAEAVLGFGRRGEGAGDMSG